MRTFFILLTVFAAQVNGECRLMDNKIKCFSNPSAVITLLDLDSVSLCHFI